MIKFHPITCLGPMRTKRKRIAILGAGISGLSLAWYLSKTSVAPEIHLFEKSGRAGGWMHTEHCNGFLFEKGPRTLKASMATAILKLAKELGLQDEIIVSGRKPYHRYLWTEKKLWRFPNNPLSFLFSPLTNGLVRAIFTEWGRLGNAGTDETVWEFALRRFNKEVARRIFDPMVTGIFGGDVHTISVKACFPTLKMWEEKYGSISRGFLLERKENEKKVKDLFSFLSSNSIFSFKNGLETIAQALFKSLNVQMHLQSKVETIRLQHGKVELSTALQNFEFDRVFCALPVKETGELFQNFDAEIANELLAVPSLGLAVVNVGYRQGVLPVKGFGYLTPSYEKEEIKGVIFDSYVFPQLNSYKHETRLTIKLDEDGRIDMQYVEAALKGIKKHLGISTAPDAISIKRALRAIPQYHVGHLEKMERLMVRARARHPGIVLHGNYLSGMSVNHIIERSEQLAQGWEREIIRS